MSLNDTPSANRVHIGFFGCRNAGKSSLVNAVTGQDLAVVSEVRGTTTDPVTKAMELLPLGPVVIIDTPGFDDAGLLGDKRVKKTKQTLARTDIAVLVVDAAQGLSGFDRELLDIFRQREIPYLIAMNKCDLVPHGEEDERTLYVSAAEGIHIRELKERLARLMSGAAEKPLVSDLIHAGDTVVLVIPIDASAPKGRIILPQQQVLRDVLNCGAIAASCREFELARTLDALREPPALVVTDSQAFEYVARIVPETVPLTSFSILMARYKGFLSAALDGVRAIESLKDGDTVLIAEGCTHHRQCEDIGTVKIPKWLASHTGSRIRIDTCSGREFPEELEKYAAVIHCGGCMLNEREMVFRKNLALAQDVPFINYGILIAYLNGILPRCVAPLGLEL